MTSTRVLRLSQIWPKHKLVFVVQQLVSSLGPVVLAVSPSYLVIELDWGGLVGVAVVVVDLAVKMSLLNPKV